MYIRALLLVKCSIRQEPPSLRVDDEVPIDEPSQQAIDHG